jgi:hypothetical protein
MEVGDASRLKQTRSKTSDPKWLTFNTNSKEKEERDKEETVNIKESRKVRW